MIKNVVLKFVERLKQYTIYIVTSVMFLEVNSVYFFRAGLFNIVLYYIKLRCSI